MNSLRYERVIESSFDLGTGVYHPEQIDDTAAIIPPSEFEFGGNGNGGTFHSIGFREIFFDPRYTPAQQRMCIGTIVTAACVVFLMLILLFVGFGKVLVDIGAVDEAEKHGIVMIPNLRSRREMVFRFGHDDRGEHLRAEYSKEIDDYLLNYQIAQDRRNTYMRKCKRGERIKGKWCQFDIDSDFGEHCSRKNNYGYDSDEPCILFAFNDDVGWTPNLANATDFLPFLCRMQYHFQSNVFSNISYFPAIPLFPKHGGFDLNKIPSRTMVQTKTGDTLKEKNKALMDLPPMLMIKISNPFNQRTFAVDCRIRDNVPGYEFDNLSHFPGITGVSFDFLPDPPRPLTPGLPPKISQPTSRITANLVKNP